MAPQQGITKIVIDTVNSETGTFGGTAFGAVGTYQKLRGVASGQLDPNDPKNLVIADIALAEKNPTSGMVEYGTDFFILKPSDLSKGNHKVYFEAPNCGGKLFGGFNGSGGGNNSVTLANDAWSWTSANTLALAGNAAFQRGWIYELTYVAKNPYIAGIGLAAVRDLMPYLRNAKADNLGTANPLASDIQSAVTWTLSQPARFMYDFIWLGFNQGPDGKKVFDGALNWIGGGNGLGINVRCTATSTCPKVMNVFSGNELWVKAGSTLTTHPNTGLDVAEPANVRNYFVSSAPHGGAGNTTTAPSTCLQYGSLVEANPLLRARCLAFGR